MRLFATQTSPYARKVRMVLMEKGIACDMEWVDLRASDHPALAHNPLGKVPVLLRNDGEPIYDSAVIVQFLEQFRPDPVIIPHDPEGRLRALRSEALSGGIMDATVAWVQEQRRSKDCQDQALLLRLRGKVVAGLTTLQQESAGWTHGRDLPVLPLQQIAAVAATAYVDLRAPDFLVQFPDLVAWLHSLHDRPSVAQTEPQ